MIVLLHGTGDDNTKPEQWMQWAQKVLEFHGEKVLNLPGIGSPQYDTIGEISRTFIAALGTRRNPGFSLSGFQAADPKLKAAISGAGREILEVARLTPFQEEAAVERMASDDKKRRMGADGKLAEGIKLRAALGALCSMAYYHRTPDARPLRVIGHSRGASAAMALHNLLCVMGFRVEKTLLLDPVHGIRKPVHKDYYKTVFQGTVTNLPAKIKSATFADQPITSGGPAANLTVYPKLQKLKHGHMGKFLAFKEENKKTGRADIKQRLEGYVQRLNVNETVHKNLHGLFRTANPSPTPDQKILFTEIFNTLIVSKFGLMRG